MNKLINNKTLIALSVMAALSTHSFAYADKCSSPQSCELPIEGSVTQTNNVIRSTVLENSERELVQETWTFHGLEEEPVKAPIDEKITHSVTSVADLPHLNFTSGKHFLSTAATTEMDKVIAKLKTKRNVKLHFIGHADSQRLSQNARKIYKTNVGLSNFRASIVAEYFKQNLQLVDDVISTEGMGDSQPIASNSTLKGMAKNRRVELVAQYDEDVIVKSATQAPAFERTQVCQFIPEQKAAFAITLDGKALTEKVQSVDADHQRCTDVALDNADIKLQYDNLQATPVLSASSVLLQKENKPVLSIQGYSNYHYFIEKGEVRLFSKDQSSQSQPLAILPLSEQLNGEWELSQVLTHSALDDLEYRIRVYGKEGQFDETGTLPVVSIETTEQEELTNNAVQQALLSHYGVNQLALQNISVSGGTVTVSGENIPDNHQVYVMNEQAPLTAQHQFVSQQIIPAGQHNVEVAVLDPQGNGELFQRHLSFKDNDWFYVALADLTIGKNSTEGPIELLTGDDHHFDGDMFVDGRIAAYTKGKWRNKYTVTASIDSTEEPLKDLFSNFNKKDPQSLFRRLEEENHYSVYGDDSTLIDDAPTQGRFYAKINDDKSHLMWGNFLADIEDTEFSRIKRGLYGANLDWNSEETTNFGERATQFTFFAAEAGTSAAYEEHRGTGGSLYYLKNQDITQGSERVSIEIRDKDSDLVIANTPLVAGQDYDVDSLQGRILLSKPLSSISNDNQIVRVGGLSGHHAYLVVNYEYTPGFEALDNLSIGGRASHWLNNQWNMGITASDQDLGEQDHKLTGLDLTYRHTAQTYFKIEGAQTKGQGVEGLRSNNGGYHFGDLTQQPLSEDANALRVESAFLFSDLGSDNQGRGNFYWQKRDAGFSGLSQFTQFDTTQVGTEIVLPVAENTNASIRLDSRDEKGGIDKQSAELNLSHHLDENWLISAGLRAEDTKPTTADQSTNTGKRTDLAFQVDYAANTKWGVLGFVQGTLSNDDTKLANNRVGVGGHYQVSDAVTLNTELSGGNQGFGGQIGTDYQYSNGSNVYLNYELDPDRTDNGLAGRNGQLVSGVRHRYSDAINVYGEERYQHGKSQQGLTHAYGIEYVPSESWLVGLSFENGSQEQAGEESLERNAVAFNANYTTTDFKYGGALEYRKDENTTETRSSYLVRNNLAYKVSPDWRAQLRVDVAISDSDQGESLNSDYSEALLGFAYRPVENDKLNALVTYNYLYDLAPAEQFTSSGTQNSNQQRSHVFAFDVNYDLSARWSIGGKYAHKKGEVRLGREGGQWFDSTTDLYVARVDWHIVRHWDFLLEARMLTVDEAEDERKGFLAAIHRHIGQHFKVGIGYNFTDFSDDLTDLDYEAKGLFLNIVGKL